MADFQDDELPLIGILRGVEPDESLDITAALIESGFSLIEVPLNSDDALASIERMVNAFGSQAMIGAGTILNEEDLQAVLDLDVSLAVMPHCNPRLIAMAKAENLICIPGVATITEAIDALDAGADGLKVFPANVLGPETIGAWRAVLPNEVIMLPVGGIDCDNMEVFLDAGADGFGLGSSLYKAGMSAQEVESRAVDFIETWDELNADDVTDEDGEDAEQDSTADPQDEAADADDVESEPTSVSA